MHVVETIFAAVSQTILRLVVLSEGAYQSCHHLTIHGVAVYQLLRPVDIGIGIALFLITEAELAESLVRETVLLYILQEISTLAVVGALIVAVGEFLSRGAVVGEGISLLETIQRLEGVVL